MDDKYFAVWYDKEFGYPIIVFATQEEIDNDIVSGDAIDISIFNEISDIVGDNGWSCEDFVLVSTKKNISEVREIVRNYGFVENEEIKNLGW